MDSFIGLLMLSQDDITQILWNTFGTVDLGTLVKSQRRRGLDQGAQQVRWDLPAAPWALDQTSSQCLVTVAILRPILLPTGPVVAMGGFV